MVSRSDDFDGAATGLRRAQSDMGFGLRQAQSDGGLV